MSFMIKPAMTKIVDKKLLLNSIFNKFNLFEFIHQSFRNIYQVVKRIGLMFSKVFHEVFKKITEKSIYFRDSLKRILVTKLTRLQDRRYWTLISVQQLHREVFAMSGDLQFPFLSSRSLTDKQSSPDRPRDQQRLALGAHSQVVAKTSPKLEDLHDQKKWRWEHWPAKLTWIPIKKASWPPAQTKNQTTADLDVQDGWCV